MVIELTPQTIVTAGAVVTAALLLVQRFANGVRWYDKQEKQSTDIESLKQQHESDVEMLENDAVYRSLIDNNVWNPSGYPAGWELVE